MHNVKQAITIRLIIISAIVISLCPIPPAISNEIHASKYVHRIEKYMNSFRTLKARFTQFDVNGTQQTGTFYLWRPGRMRLAYDGNPQDQFAHNNQDQKIDGDDQQHIMVADGDTLFDYNPALDELTEIPLSATPASFILRETISFKDDIKVTHLQQQHGIVFLSMVRRDDPDAGELTLVFNAEPLTLVEWKIIDSQSHITRVVLDNIETGIKLDSQLFTTKF